MTDEKKLKVVFDGMIFIQAVISDSGPAATLFTLLEAKKFSLFISDEVLNEVRSVLSRPKLRAAKKSLTDELIEAFIRRVSQRSTLVRNVQHKFTYPRDPKDEKYINLAVEAKATYLVSRDNDLLDLMTGYTAECKDFRQRFRRLKVIDPVEFLRAIGGDAGADE